jgi:hypothetical protein
MELEQLMGRYFRLQQELSLAYRERPWHSARLDRLADDLAATEREIAARQPTDEQSNDSVPSLATTGWQRVAPGIEAAPK